ncbi:MAG TPA: hypothetical protein VKH15_18230 [Candidatus Acidoferrum sp.]|nr:hypothetical protein [Candidatus Acidoferrum sp.]
MPTAAKTFIAIVLTAGAAILFHAASTWSTTNLAPFAAFLALTLIASTLKTRIPGMTGTMSPNFAFLLIGMVSFSFSEVVAASFAAALLQCVWRPKQRLQLVQVLFSAATLPISCAASFWSAHAIVSYLSPNSPVGLVILAGCFYLSINTVLVSIVIGLVQGQSFQQVWQNCFDAVFPSFLVGILLTGLLAGSVTEIAAWRKSLLLLPAVVLGHLYLMSRHRSTADANYGMEELREEELVGSSSGRK